LYIYLLCIVGYIFICYYVWCCVVLCVCIILVRVQLDPYCCRPIVFAFCVGNLACAVHLFSLRAFAFSRLHSRTLRLPLATIVKAVFIVVTTTTYIALCYVRCSLCDLHFWLRFTVRVHGSVRLLLVVHVGIYPPCIPHTTAELHIVGVPLLLPPYLSALQIHTTTFCYTYLTLF